MVSLVRFLNAGRGKIFFSVPQYLSFRGQIAGVVIKQVTSNKLPEITLG